MALIRYDFTSACSATYHHAQRGRVTIFSELHIMRGDYVICCLLLSIKSSCVNNKVNDVAIVTESYRCFLGVSFLPMLSTLVGLQVERLVLFLPSQQSCPVWWLLQ